MDTYDYREKLIDHSDKEKKKSLSDILTLYLSLLAAITLFVAMKTKTKGKRNPAGNDIVTVDLGSTRGSRRHASLPMVFRRLKLA